MSRLVNIGTTDRVVRFLVAAILFGIGFFDNPIVSGGTAKMIIGIFAFIPLLTALFRYCPLYTLIGVNTCKPK